MDAEGPDSAGVSLTGSNSLVCLERIEHAFLAQQHSCGLVDGKLYTGSS